MALKKSELYSSLWSSCDELRGGMDASQYKDYVLVLLFIKYVSDKYAGVPYAPIIIPEGASFKDMVALKGKPDIGDQINKKIIGPLANANKLSDMPDFNDATKLGSGKEMVDRLTNLIAIFENKALDFSKNRADGDDILGDAYEYLMRHFATESGKSKGQFYTPAEVSRIMAQILGIRDAKTSDDTTVYDPTCGSGSLLLKVGDEADAPRSRSTGRKKTRQRSGLARMNMILHNNPTALIKQGNTLADPKFKDGDDSSRPSITSSPIRPSATSAGAPASIRSTTRTNASSTSVSPPGKQGDYAYLLHIVRSLKSTGKGACILPHGVLFRGNAEADIRKNLVRKGYIKGIIGLPANLFYGTGIPACIVVIDKEDAHARKGIFMIDASSGFMKDGPKNRLREQDIHKIVDAFNKQLELPKFSRMVIGRRDREERLQPQHAALHRQPAGRRHSRHRGTSARAASPIATSMRCELLGGLPELCERLSSSRIARAISILRSTRTTIKSTIYEPSRVHHLHRRHERPFRHVASRRRAARSRTCRSAAIQAGHRRVVRGSARSLRRQAAHRHLRLYQHLMDYWATTMQDDCYPIAADGWKAETYRVIETKKRKGKEKDKGWACDLVPKSFIVARYFAKEQEAITKSKPISNRHRQAHRTRRRTWRRRRPVLRTRKVEQSRSHQTAQGGQGRQRSEG